VRFPQNVGLSAWRRRPRAGVSGDRCAARAPAGAVTGSRVAGDVPGVQLSVAAGDRGVLPVTPYAPWCLVAGN